MNPFNVDRFIRVNINTGHLSSVPGGLDRQSFIEQVARTIRQKLDGVNVEVTVDAASGIGATKTVYVHDRVGIDSSFGDVADLGCAHKADGQAEVDVNDVWESLQSLGGGNVGHDEFAEAVGTVCSHETGHLVLPFGHSGGPSNLMSDGPSIMDALGDGGDSLAFTEFQKDLMNSVVAAQDDPTLLPALERLQLSVAEAEHEAAGMMSDGGMFGAPCGIDSPAEPAGLGCDPEVWGSLEPELIDSVSGLAVPDVYGELAADFDLASLGEVGSADLAALLDGLGDVDGGEVLGDLLESILECLG